MYNSGCAETAVQPVFEALGGNFHAALNRLLPEGRIGGKLKVEMERIRDELPQGNGGRANGPRDSFLPAR